MMGKGRNRKREKKMQSKKINKRKNNYPPKKYKLNFTNNMNFSSKERKNGKLHFKKGLRNSNIIKTNKQNNHSNNIRGTSNKDGGNKSSSAKKSDKKVKISFNDYELNTLDYKNALSYDKRTCSEYYLALLKTKNAIIFSFCPRNDYNSIIIRSYIFSLSLSIYYSSNFAFFTDEIMHHIYEESGKYDILFFLPKILIAFFASYYITVIIKIIFLSERNISQIRRQFTLSNAYNISDKVRKNLIIKYTIFFIIGLIFLVFFWMLLSSFGAVYANTQMFIFKNTLISFTISLIYPFFINIFPSIFRICSLSSRNGECLYKVSKFLQIL